jgi:predicted naringenin-chalcone synthase
MAAYRSCAPDLACAAARRALDAAHVAPEQITHLFTSTCTGFAAPGPDQDVIERLGLRSSVRRVLFGFQGCSAGIASLRTASEIAQGDSNAVILVVAVELSSLHFQPSMREEDLRGHALFADGAGAAVIAGPAPSMRNGSAGRGNAGGGSADGEAAIPRTVFLARASCRLVPSTRDHMTWTVGDHGFLMRLGSEVPDTLGALLPDFIKELTGEVADSSELWAIHPGGPAILDRIESALRLSPQDLAPSRSILRRHGNMSSATIFFVFEEILRMGRSGPGNALAFGPGLTIEGLRFHVG